jgi:hypothetical protein
MEINNLRKCVELVVTLALRNNLLGFCGRLMDFL